MSDVVSSGDALIELLVEASSQRDGLAGSASVVLAVDGGPETVIEINDGRVTGPGPADGAPVKVPLTSKQLGLFATGEDSLAMAFMRGDVKPVGATGALLHLVELFDDDTVRARLAELV